MVRVPTQPPRPREKSGGRARLRAPPGAPRAPQEMVLSRALLLRDILYQSGVKSRDAKLSVQPKLLAEPTPGKKSMSLKSSKYNSYKSIGIYILIIIYSDSF